MKTPETFKIAFITNDDHAEIWEITLDEYYNIQSGKGLKEGKLLYKVESFPEEFKQ